MKQKSILYILIFILGFAFFDAFGQDNQNLFPKTSFNTQNTGMLILGGWAAANLIVGGYGWSKTTGQEKYFHQMNFMWNLVNLSIAGFALYSNAHTSIETLSISEVVTKHLKTEKVLLINAALDVGYVGTGFLLRHYSTKSDKFNSLLKGYGNSLILQGVFLLVFDLSLYGVLHSQRIEFLGVTPTLNGLALTAKFSF
jgi:hypothetical protein